MKANRRSETRVEVSLPVQVTNIGTGEGKHIKLSKVLPIVMVNLSASGVKLFSLLDLPHTLKLFIDLYIEEDTISCYAEIVRKEKNSEGYFYGCKLHPLLDSDKIKLRKYIYKVQIQKIKYTVSNLEQTL